MKNLNIKDFFEINNFDINNILKNSNNFKKNDFENITFNTQRIQTPLTTSQERLLNCKSFEEILEHKYYHSLNDKLNIYLFDKKIEKEKILRVSLSKIIFTYKKEILEKYFSHISHHLMINFTNITDIKVKDLLNKKMYDNDLFLKNYFENKDFRKEIKHFITNDHIVNNPEIVLLSFHNFSIQLLEQCLDVFTQNNMLNNPYSKLILSSHLLFSLHPELFNEKFVNFLKENDLLKMTNKVHFDSNFKIKKTQDNNSIIVNLAENFLLKENKEATEFLVKNGLTISTDIERKCLNIVNKMLEEDSLKRPDFYIKAQKKIAYFENIVIRKTSILNNQNNKFLTNKRI